MKTKNIALSSLLIFSSFMSYCSQNEMSIREQDVIIQSLYDGEVDLDSLNHEVAVMYVQILKDHKAVLRYMIENHCGYLNNVDAMKGTICAWFGFPWLASSVAFFTLFFIDKGGNYRIPLVREPVIVALYSCFMAVSLLLSKKACSLLNKAWHAKEYAMRDLAKDEELLAQLESLNTN